MPGRSYTELVEFQAFLTDRTARLLRDRYASIRSVDRNRPIVAHTAFPSTFFTGTGFLPFEQALARGNDWDHAEIVDVLGCSQFPTWFNMTPADFGARIESGRSAAQAANKPYWVAELQGGSHRHGIQATPPVTGAVQQRWVWNGYSRGSKAVNFWCWRDEIFGREASGFGITGDDGHAPGRLAELARTAKVVREWSDLLDGYEPEAARIGVVFSPSSYHLDWAQRGANCSSAGASLHGYLRALERAQFPYRVVESHRPGNLDGLRLIIVPWALVIEPVLAAALTDWVQDGGRLLVETEAGAYDAAAFYHYPDERPFMTGFGLRGTGRRPIEDPVLTVELGGAQYPLRAASWLEAYDPAGNRVLSGDPRCPTAVARSFGSGEVLALGTHAGLAYEQAAYPEFEKFVGALVQRAGIQPSWHSPISDGDQLQWLFGRSGEVPLLFVTNAGPSATVYMTACTGALNRAQRAFDLESGQKVGASDDGGQVTLTLNLARDAWQVLRFE
jgi:beta-galactosidase